MNINIVEKELKNLNKYIINSLEDPNNNISAEICEFLFSKSKRIRPKFVFLFSKALKKRITKKTYHLACAIELIHNSTLIHDDILDNAETRRSKISLNIKLGNNLSVLAGDIILSIALKELANCKNTNIISNFAKSLYFMCKGEINQHFSINKLPSIEEYIQKSKYKTAELFKASLTSLCDISNIKEKELINNFATNFGIAFQIKDDLSNILKSDKSKPILSDIHNGIYTVPVIFLNYDKNIAQLTKEEIIQTLLTEKKYINKTLELIKEYANRAIESISFIEDNKYKREIIQITENLYKAGINE